MNFPYGECECRNGCQCEANPGPAYCTVERDGKTMKVCTRCDFKTDKPTQKLLVKPTDSPEPWQSYDILGFYVILGMLNGDIKVQKAEPCA